MTHSPSTNGKEFPGILYLTSAHSPFNMFSNSAIINADTTNGDVIIYLPHVQDVPNEVFSITKSAIANRVLVIQWVKDTLQGPNTLNSFSPILFAKGDFIQIKSDGRYNWAIVSENLTNPLDLGLPPIGPPLSQPRVNSLGTGLEYFLPTLINPTGLVRVNIFDAVAAIFPVDLNQHGLIIIDASTNNVEIDLPTAVGNRGKGVYIQRSDSSINTASIKGFGAETINGVNIISVQPLDDFLVVSNGTNWQIL